MMTAHLMSVEWKQVCNTSSDIGEREKVRVFGPFFVFNALLRHPRKGLDAGLEAFEVQQHWPGGRECRESFWPEDIP